MSKHKLLLADDSITIQKVVNLTFADEGIEVISVGDGSAAMERFVEVMPDLVMIDVNMPGVDGYRICELIKQDEATKNVPVILLVGSFEPFDEEEARRVGANDYLTKPFQSIRQLVNKVTVLLNQSNGQGDAPETVEDTGVPQSQPTSFETVSLDLGDAGMDDEMIQTDQVSSGSFPEVSRTEPLEGAVDATHDESTTEFEGAVKIPEEQNPRDDAGDRAAYLEEQMVSEFESDEPVTESFETMNLTSPDDYFAGQEIADAGPPIPEEITDETDHMFEAGSLDADNTSGSENYGAEPSELPDVAEPDLPGEVQEISVEAESLAGPEDATIVESDVFGGQDMPGSEYVEDDAVPSGEAESATGQSIEFSNEFETGESEGYGPDTADVLPAEMVIEWRAPDSGTNADRVEYPGEPVWEDEPGAATDETPQFERQYQDTEDLSEHRPETAEAAEPEGDPNFFSPEDPEKVWYKESLEFQDAPAPESVAEGFSESAADTSESSELPPEIVHGGEYETGEIKSLVSNKDRTDAVESVIVSEFARHSINLSSEAVETIAARIAEKISEKIVQEMASEVVSDLADLIVEKMERKRQQE